jgi:hypothetical protein
MNIKTDKRGITFNLFYVMAYIIFGIVLLAILGFIFSSIRTGLNQDEMIGQVNLSNASESTYGVFETAYNDNLDVFGLFLIFGMIGGLLIASFMLRGTWNKLLIVVDLILMVVVYITAVLISNTYEHLLIASSGIITQFEGSMPKTSNFVLHLPRYVVIIGAVCMILFYSAIPRREDERQPAQSYQEGAY